MIYLLSQETDSVPFFLKKEVIASVDTIPNNEFIPYQYLQLDSSEVFFDLDAFDFNALSSGMEGLVRPFMHQFEGVLFLIFTLFFVLYALIFKDSGRVILNDFSQMFTLGNRYKNFNGGHIVISGVWTKLFFVVQTFALYSILSFDIILQHSSLFIGWHNYNMLLLSLFVCLLLFAFSKYLLYKFVGALFSTSKTGVLSDVYLWVIYLIGILSFIPIVLYIYIPETKLFVLFYLLAVFIAGRIIVFIKSFAFFIKSHIGSLYFFVYLCGIEVMPYLLVYRVIVLIK